MTRQTAATRYFQNPPTSPNIRPSRSGDEAQGGERHGQAEDEEQGKDERPPHGRRLPVAGDDAHEQRDHGQDAGIQGRRDAAEENGDDRQPGIVLEELGDIAEKARHVPRPYFLAPCLTRSATISSLGKKPT